MEPEDKNEDGTINSGSELFGSSSGDGFKDLSIYDEDQNGWIDENNPIFDKLRVWFKSEGRDELIGIGEVGIGAIFLGNSDTPFSLKSESNELLGEMRKSGFFLFEAGGSGLISQIDLAITDKTKKRLEALEEIKKNSIDLNRSYNQPEASIKDDSRVTKLISELKGLEGQLLTAPKEEKGPLQVQINVIRTQIMSLL